jgi:hypothetical protein
MKWTNMINKEKYQEFQMYTNIFFVYKVFKCFISKIEWNGQIWLKKIYQKFQMYTNIYFLSLEFWCSSFQR